MDASEQATTDALPKLDIQLTDWRHLLPPPEERALDDEFYRLTILTASSTIHQTLLEVGSDGRNNALYLKQYSLESWRELNAVLKHGPWFCTGTRCSRYVSRLSG